MKTLRHLPRLLVLPAGTQPNLLHQTLTLHLLCSARHRSQLAPLVVSLHFLLAPLLTQVGDHLSHLRALADPTDPRVDLETTWTGLRISMLHKAIISWNSRCKEPQVLNPTGHEEAGLQAALPASRAAIAAWARQERTPSVQSAIRAFGISGPINLLISWNAR